MNFRSWLLPFLTGKLDTWGKKTKQERERAAGVSEISVGKDSLGGRFIIIAIVFLEARALWLQTGTSSSRYQPKWGLRLRARRPTVGTTFGCQEMSCWRNCQSPCSLLECWGSFCHHKVEDYIKWPLSWHVDCSWFLMSLDNRWRTAMDQW